MILNQICDRSAGGTADHRESRDSLHRIPIQGLCERAMFVPVRRRNQSHPLARDDNAVDNDRHGEQSKTEIYYGLKTLCTKVLFISHTHTVQGLGPRYQTIQYGGLCHVTLPMGEHGSPDMQVTVSSSSSYVMCVPLGEHGRP
jgi:hypothetical protein